MSHPVNVRVVSEQESEPSECVRLLLGPCQEGEQRLAFIIERLEKEEVYIFCLGSECWVDTLGSAKYLGGLKAINCAHLLHDMFPDSEQCLVLPLLQVVLTIPPPWLRDIVKPRVGDGERSPGDFSDRLFIVGK